MNVKTHSYDSQSIDFSLFETFNFLVNTMFMILFNLVHLFWTAPNH